MCRPHGRDYPTRWFLFQHSSVHPNIANQFLRSLQGHESSIVEAQSSRPDDVLACHFLYHAPSFLPTHQITPTVAVCCSLLSTPSRSLRKDGWFEKSRRHSYRIRNPLENL